MRTDELLSLAYASKATHPQSEQELTQLLGSSRRFNASAALTGMLVYRDGRFLQILEGPENATQSLFKRIEEDTRHERVRLLRVQHIRDRAFSEWTMGFQTLAANSGSIPKGFRSTFDDLENDNSEVVQRALLELSIWFRARNGQDPARHHWA